MCINSISPEKSLLHFREVEPYWDKSQVPLLTFKATAPFRAKLLSIESLVGPTSTSETYKVVLDHSGKFNFWEGQCCGVIPPGINLKNGKNHGNRLYSIASTRYGDDMSGNTVSLCVKRLVVRSDQNDISFQGVCSNYLCDANVGDEFLLTGPTGKVMLLPEESPNTDIIMIATGTGVAPFRSFMRRLFIENTHAANKFCGRAWLFFGVPGSESRLFSNEWQELQSMYPERFKVTYALSREERNIHDGKMYVQHRIAEHAEELFNRMSAGAHIYFCGLKGMMSDIMVTLENLSTERGLEWTALLKSWKEEGRWHVEVY